MPHNLIMLQQFASRGGCAPFLDCLDGTCVVLQQAVDSLLRYLPRIFACAHCELVKLGLLLGCEMYFHAESVGIAMQAVKIAGHPA